VELTESLLSLIAQSNPGAYAIYRVDGGKMTALFRADSLPAISGMTPEEYAACTQDDAAAIILPADRAQVAALLAALLADGKDADFTYRILHKTQGSVWVHATARLLGTLNGVPVLIVVFGSTTYEAEEHAFLLSHSADSVYVVDRESRELLYANEPALRAWGKGDYSGLRCYEYVHGASQLCPWCSIPKMRHGETHQNACYDPACDRWFSIDCIEMNWHGRPAVAVYGADITERIRRQQSLELDKKSLDTIINNIPVGVGVCELQGEKIRSTSVNPQLTEMLGMTADAFAAPRADTLTYVHPDDRAQLLENVHKGRQPGARIRFDFRFRRTLPEAYRWYHVEASTLKTADGATVFVCITDTTAEKQALEDRRNARRMYEAAVEEAQLVVWQYDLIHHRVTMADNEFTQYDYRKFGLPKVTENAPEALVPYIAEADQEKFLAMYRAVAAGEPKASCEVWYKLRPGHEPRCEHLSYTTLFDEDGRPVGAPTASGRTSRPAAARRRTTGFRIGSFPNRSQAPWAPPIWT
jgi:PAS domain-containing protein